MCENCALGGSPVTVVGCGPDCHERLAEHVLVALNQAHKETNGRCCIGPRSRQSAWEGSKHIALQSADNRWVLCRSQRT